jgi:hypothetical protein
MKKVVAVALLALVTGFVMPAFASVVVGCTTSGVSNLVSSCGPETAEFAGWSPTGDTSWAYVYNLTAHAGFYGGAYGEEDGLSYLSQALPTAPGTTYDLEFWVRGTDKAWGEATFAVAWNGITVSADIDTPGPAYTSMQFLNLNASGGATTTVQFGFKPSSGILITPQVSIPEPSTFVLLLGGVGLLGASKLRRRLQL